MKNNRSSLKTLWWTLSLPPVFFLLAIVFASIYFGAQGQTDPAQITQSVAGAMAYVTLIVQVALLGLLLLAKRIDHLSWGGLGWKIMPGQKLWREALIGALPGFVLGVLYITVLSPLLELIQSTLGDYVPAGQILTSFGSGILGFFLANVLFAPFVEEGIYRGYGLNRLLGRFSQPVAILISCIFFGLLHWAGGFWYILLVGGIAGGLFAWLLTWRKNMIAPFAAHLALNLVEFLYVWILIK